MATMFIQYLKRTNKTIALLLLMTIGFVSCKKSENKIDRVEIAKQYYSDLDDSSFSNMSYWFADSLKIIEGEHITMYSKNDYIEFLKWDSVFNPSYDILEIEEQNDIVKAKISKMDKRIFFLHEKPFVTHQIIRFQNDKIISVEIDYLNFDYPTWEKNKNGLLSWIDANHPELNGFIHDQTESGGMKFLKAMTLYNNEK
jgi:hypothetical protein